MSFTVSKIPETHSEVLDRYFGVKDCMVEINPGRCILPATYPLIGHKILNMKMRTDDVLLVSYPRTGSTWCLEIIRLLRSNLDFEAAKKKILQNQAPFLETSSIFADCQDAFPWLTGYEDSVDAIDAMASPRTIRTHLPLNLLPVQIETVKPKVIYVARNPKDIIPSLYHHCQLFHNLDADFEEYCQMFLDGKLPYGPIFDHIMKFWEKRSESNFLFITYEEMRRDIEAAIERIANFLEVEVSKEKKDLLLDHLSFDNMKKNDACNMKYLIEFKRGKEFCNKNDYRSIMRKGEIGDWQNHMKEETSKKFDEFIRSNTVGTGLVFGQRN